MKSKAKIPHIISIIISAVALVGTVYSTALFVGTLSTEDVGAAVAAVILVLFGIGTAIVAAVALILNIVALAMKPEGKLKVSVKVFTVIDAIMIAANVLYIVIAIVSNNAAQ
ncbi:MAG: hypothetical protein ACI3XX_00330 [Eubacteriales bacterium]